jgi:hypothetical protein
MNEHVTEERDPLLAELEALFGRIDPPPADVVEAAAAAPEILAAWHDLDAGLLAILDDSALKPEFAGVRSGDGPRLVTFGSVAEDSDSCTVEVEVGVEPSGTLRLIGLVVPTGPAELEVRHPGGAVRVSVDELGRFRASGVPSGPLSLVIYDHGQRTTATDWITV